MIKTVGKIWTLSWLESPQVDCRAGIGVLRCRGGMSVQAELGGRLTIHGREGSAAWAPLVAAHSTLNRVPLKGKEAWAPGWCESRPLSGWGLLLGLNCLAWLALAMEKQLCSTSLPIRWTYAGAGLGAWVSTKGVPRCSCNWLLGGGPGEMGQDARQHLSRKRDWALERNFKILQAS